MPLSTASDMGVFVGIIVGSVVGGLALIALIVGGVLLLKSRKNSRQPKANAGAGVAANSNYDVIPQVNASAHYDEADAIPLANRSHYAALGTGEVGTIVGESEGELSSE